MKFISKLFWIKHPKNNEPDTMLTFSTYAFIGSLFKFMLNGVVVGSVNFGTVDAILIGAILTPTLAAYFARKHSDNITSKKKRHETT